MRNSLFPAQLFITCIPLRRISVLIMTRAIQLIKSLLPALLGSVIKHERDFLNAHSARLGEVEIRDSGNDEIDGNIDPVIAPRNLSEGDGIHESGGWHEHWCRVLGFDSLIKGIAHVVECDVDGETFCTKRVWEILGSVARL